MKLEVTGLCFSYGARLVLDDVSFTARDGELIAVLGPNGVGKSTLFRCILGFLRPQGRILLDGRELGSLSRAQLAQAVAYIPQSAEPVFNYTVLDLVSMGFTNRLGVFQQPSAAQLDRARSVLDALGILALENQGCGAVSGGERQLALLARALVQDARVLVMDEPTANLDYGNQFRVMERISALAGRGYTILFSTHDPNQALRHASRVLALQNGSLLADGPPSEALSADTLSRLYGIQVALEQVQTPVGPLRISVPLENVKGEPL